MFMLLNGPSEACPPFVLRLIVYCTDIHWITVTVRQHLTNSDNINMSPTLGKISLRQLVNSRLTEAVAYFYLKCSKSGNDI